MRFLILSDIHANLTALEAVLAAVNGRWGRAVCLGDVVGYGPDPNEVVDRVKELSSATIRGNHDKAASGIGDAEDFNPVARTAANWTREQLRPENLEYLLNLPQGPLEQDGLALVHGALYDEDEYVFAPAQALDGLLESPSRVTFFGHTHFQGGFSYRDNRLEVLQLRPEPGAHFAALQLEPATRYLLNPGSIGQPRDGDARAAFAIADMAHAVVEFWRVPYDIPAVQHRMKQVGLPEPLILRLAFGR
jgi:diadenosine tetraphosphatase ApaH/serine/threonine PP2A family protein phosphatase